MKRGDFGPIPMRMEDADHVPRLVANPKRGWIRYYIAMLD